MKKLSGALVAVVLVVLGSEGLALARWNRPPPGSYRDSCTNIQFNGHTLKAHCRDRSGRRVRTSLANPHRCRRDIANINGTLVCR